MMFTPQCGQASVERSYTPSAAHGEAFVADVQTFYRKNLVLPVRQLRHRVWGPFLVLFQRCATSLCDVPPV